MMNYEDILNEAKNKNIQVKEIKLNYDLKGLYMNNKIIISTDLKTNAEKKCILSEEIGHHETSLGNILNLNNISNMKQEVKARRWACEYLIKIDDLINAYKSGARNTYEIAEFLDVTETFLEESLINYKKRYGYFTDTSKYRIYFIPTLKISKKI